MNWIFISGPKSLFAGLLRIDGLDITSVDVEDLGGGQQRISAEATDDAIVAIQALGLTVEIEKTDAQVGTYIAGVLAGEDPDSDIA